MKYQGKSMMSLNQMAEIGIKYQGDGYVTGFPIISDNDAYILNGVIEANEEYIAIEQWIPVFPESLQPVSPSLTDDQQVVLEWLKEETQRRRNIHAALYWFYETNVELDLIPSSLSDVEWCQVLAAFAEWGLNSCQNGNS
ncbi:hypothetical protein ACVN9X_03215 [Enterococcus dispar]|uniref:Uncharacterized protein n=1 Tax=Enterococcus dispar ATCC 51266 TaxID=1139219 RepID=S1N7B2_9ENTE|nr:hypothetical protein [Enterococcus dispar]EOT42614.1 hypothetical protein OMK_00975 [Enterococcus dispar ATCC 51266]EOW84935.1 hypothetical protein I569_00224 [Enterococcus dispar ATCC 51266]